MNEVLFHWVFCWIRICWCCRGRCKQSWTSIFVFRNCVRSESKIRCLRFDRIHFLVLNSGEWRSMTSGFQFREWLIRSSNLVRYHMGESHDISGDSQENKYSLNWSQFSGCIRHGFFCCILNLISINEPESNCSSGIDAWACNSVQRARYADRLTSICLLLWYYVIIMFTKSLPTTNYPAISPWCHGSCEKRYNKWNCVQPIQFNVVIVVVGHVHTCLGNECSGGGTAVLICRFDSLVACIRSLGSGGRARVRVGMCGDSLDSFWCVRRTCERARKRYLKSGKLPRLFKKMKMSCCCCCCLSHRGEHLA